MTPSGRDDAVGMDVAGIPTAELQGHFVAACEEGSLPLVRELLTLSGERFVDVHAGVEFALDWACWRGHVNMVRELLALSGDRRVDVQAGNECGVGWACEGGHLDVVRELLALTGDRLICPLGDALPSVGCAMLASGLGDPHSPAAAATWRAISSPGMMCTAKADPKAREAAAVGYRVYKWGERSDMVLCRQCREAHLPCYVRGWLGCWCLHVSSPVEQGFHAWVELSSTALCVLGPNGQGGNRPTLVQMVGSSAAGR